MAGKHRGSLIASLALVAATVSTGQAQSNLARCRIDVANGNLTIARTHQSSLAQCLRFANYQCESNYAWISSAVDALFNVINTGACADAYSAENLSAEVLFYGIRLPSWYYDYPGQGIELYNAADLYSSNNWGLNAKARYDLDLPDEAPESIYERKCIRAAQNMYAKAVRTGMLEQIACARAGGEPPWNCPLSVAEGTRLASALLSMDKKIAKCRDAAGVLGSVSGPVAEMCNHAVVSTDDLADCLRQSALCQVCALSNTTLDLDHDCAAISGDHDCDPQFGQEFGKALEGSAFVANEGDSSITAFDSAGGYAGADLAASTVAVGADPVDVVVGERSNVVVSVNRGGNSVTMTNSRDGSYIGGSFAAATVAVGSQPSAAAIHPESDFLYVTNQGSDSVTLLDSFDGSYVFGSLAASTFPVGRSPSAVAVHDALLYVANSGDGTVVFLDARSGLPAFGSVGLSTFAVGSNPSALSVYLQDGSWRLAVANQDDDTLVILDADTGLPADGSVEASRRSVGAGPVAMTTIDHNGPALFVAAGEGSAISALREGDEPWLTGHGALASQNLALEHPPGGVAPVSAMPYRNGAAARLVVTSPETDTVYRMPVMTPYELAGPSAAERSMIPLPPNPLFVAANDEVPGFYVVYLLANVGVDPLLFVDAAGQIHWEVELPANTVVTGIAYSAATDTVFVGTRFGVIYYDGSGGGYRFGTSAASTFSCGCMNGQPRFVDDATGILYVTCGSGVAMLDTADGSCASASPPAIPVTGTLHDVAIDREAGALYIAFHYSTGMGTRRAVVRHDAVTGAYYDGTYEDSLLEEQTGNSGGTTRLALSGDGGTLYVLDSTASQLRAIDTGSHALLGSKQFTAENLGSGLFQWLHADAASGRVLIFRTNSRTLATVPSPYYPYTQPVFDDVVYLDGGTLEFVGGDVESSRILLGESDRGGAVAPPFAYNQTMDVMAAVAYDAVENLYASCCENTGPGLILFDPSAAAFHLDRDPSEVGSPMATGDRPGAVAAMPAHTQPY